MADSRSEMISYPLFYAKNKLLDTASRKEMITHGTESNHTGRKIKETFTGQGAIKKAQANLAKAKREEKAK